MTAISIGKKIYDVLNNNEELINLIGENKIFPLVADEKTLYPFIVYRRTNLNQLSSKDKYMYVDSANYEIIVAATGYTESIEIAEKVREALTEANADEWEFNLINSSEEYADNAYIQILDYEIQIIK